MTKSAIERLVDANPQLEIWWDSSPLVYAKWKQRLLDDTSPAMRSVVEDQLIRLFDLDDPTASIVRGCTTNPPLAYEAVKADPDFWHEWIADTILDNPDLDAKEIAWLTYEETVRLGARGMEPIWRAITGALTRESVRSEGVCTLGMYADSHPARALYHSLGYRTAHAWASRRLLWD